MDCTAREVLLTVVWRQALRWQVSSQSQAQWVQTKLCTTIPSGHALAFLESGDTLMTGPCLFQLRAVSEARHDSRCVSAPAACPDREPSAYSRADPQSLPNRRAWRKAGLNLLLRLRSQQSCALRPWLQRFCGPAAECAQRTLVWWPWSLPAPQQHRGGLSRQPQGEPRVRQFEGG